MPRLTESFARYLPITKDAEAWGLVVKAGGRIINEPGETYPPAGHPDDHAFSWKRGRVLGCWQVLMITAGEGMFDAQLNGGSPQPVKTGDVLIICPGRWHRYRPTVSTGWTEHWIELDGDVLVRLSALGLLPSECRLARPLDFENLTDAMVSLHRILNEREGGEKTAELAAAGLRVLGFLTARTSNTGTRLERAVKRAESLLACHVEGRLAMPTLAKELGVNYAVFRREFRRRTGLAPAQYLMRLRLSRAQRLIGSSSFTLEAIAEQLGFSSAFHLSSAFKKRYGVAPAVWRRGG